MYHQCCLITRVRARPHSVKSLRISHVYPTHPPLSLPLQRKREADKKKLDAELVRKEHDRLKLELLRDKAERLSQRGEPVPPELMAQIAALSGIGPPVPSGPSNPKEAMAKALQAVAAFKTNNAGASAAATLRTLVKNALEKGDDPKFRSLKLDNEKIRERLVAVTGSLLFLKAAGEATSDNDRLL